MKYQEFFEQCEIGVAGRKLKIDGKHYTKTEFKHAVIGIAAGSESEYKQEFFTLLAKGGGESRQIVSELYDSLVDKCVQASARERQEMSPTLDNPLMNEGLVLVTDILTGQEFVVNFITMRLTTYHPHAYWSKFTGAERKEMELHSKKNGAHMVFEPQAAPYYLKDGIPHFNKYLPPIWRTKECEPEGTILLNLLNHLYGGDKGQINYTLSWLYNLLARRNETALVLNGPKGVGKNALYTLAKALVGHQYCAEAPLRFGQKEFNIILRNSVLILIDEHIIDKSKYNFLKASFNQWQTIEAKGKDVGHTEKTSTNFMIFHNSPDDIYLENSERRFSVMDITPTRLDKVWDKKKLDTFFQAFDNPESEIVAKTGKFILNWGKENCSEDSVFDNWTGQRYEEIIECHLPTAIKSVVNLLEQGKHDNGKIYGKDINKNIHKISSRRFDVRATRMRSLLEEYRYKREYVLGEVDIKAHPWFVQINPEVLKLLEEKQNEDI